MAKFFFHTEDGGVQPDEDGIELGSMSDAQYEAVRVLGEILKERATDFWNDGGLRVTVTDDQDLVLFMLDVSATIAPAASLRSPRLPRRDAPEPD